MLFLKRRPTSLCSRRLRSRFQDVPRPSFYFLEDHYLVRLTLSSLTLAKRGLLCFRYFSYLSWTFQPNKVSWLISVDVSAELVYVLTDGAAVYWEVYRLHLKTFITQVTIIQSDLSELAISVEFSCFHICYGCLSLTNTMRNTVHRLPQ